MSAKEKDTQEVEEASVVGGIKGFQSPFGSGQPTKKKNNIHKPYGESFEKMVAGHEMMSEKIQKQGDKWAVIDAETGAQVALVATREQARQKQVELSQRKKAKKKQETEHQRQKRSLKPQLAKKPEREKEFRARQKQKQAAMKTAQKKRAKPAKKEGVVRENSAISYVFENSPLSEDLMQWESLFSNLGRETVRSDPMMREILRNIAETEVRTLGKAMGTIKKVLEATNAFIVDYKDPERDPVSGGVQMNFEVGLKENNHVLEFGIKLENGKPLVMFPEYSRKALNTMANKESKLLRAELMHMQETVFDYMEDVVKGVVERNNYLKSVQEKVSAALGEMNMLEVSMLKNVLKKNYRGIK